MLSVVELPPVKGAVRRLCGGYSAFVQRRIATDIRRIGLLLFPTLSLEAHGLKSCSKNGFIISGVTVSVTELYSLFG